MATLLYSKMSLKISIEDFLMHLKKANLLENGLCIGVHQMLEGAYDDYILSILSIDILLAVMSIDPVIHPY